MANYSIGLSGLSAAQSAIDVIGNNIANAATPGYHKKEIVLTPAYSKQMGDVFLGGGVRVGDVVRRVDTLLEQEILRQNSSLASLSQELKTLTTIENSLGELSGGGTLSLAIDDFFNSIDDLSAYPSDSVRQNHVINAAENLADQFRRLGSFLDNLQSQIKFETDVIIDQVNNLTSEIAGFNKSIRNIEIADGDAGSLLDQRDKLISDLSGLVQIQATQKEFGVVDIIISGFSAVTGTSSNELETGINHEGQLGIGIKGGSTYKADMSGGKLGGLMSLTNDLVDDIEQRFDDLARTFMDQINSIHVQSIGSAGSFTSITSANTVGSDLADIDNISDGSFFIRVTDTATGQITRHEITVTKATDTVSDIAAEITAIDGLTASIVGSKLNITADTGFEFDFIPALLPSPNTSDLPVDVAVSGNYTGSENRVYTFNVLGSGDISTTDGLSIGIEVDGQFLKAINVGSGYANGDPIEIDEGIFISLDAGTLTAGQSFSVEAIADSDTSGMLNALGINTLFCGTNAADMIVSSDIADWPARLGVSQGADMGDNIGITKILNIRDMDLDELDGLSIAEYNRMLATDVGQNISIRQMRVENVETMLQSLVEQQGDISGVDINEQAAQLIMYEQMFQAMAKYISTLQSSMSSLMEIV
ncbi:MAG: flagellar hook-associated protein FlgK [Anaerohalosphaera sp.]|nr:flagellar hook-associated protein FlgK [Anaerohalosphaera sp.]